MVKRLAYIDSVLFAGMIIAGLGIGCSGCTAHTETVQQVKLSDASTAGTKQFWSSTEVSEAIEHYASIVKDTRKHDNSLLYGILSNALNDDDMEIRAAAVSSLGALGNKVVIPELLASLSDEEMWVRLAAASAIGDINDKEVIPELIRMLNHDDARVRESVSLALGAADYQGEIPGLSEAVKKKEIDPRIADYLLSDVNNVSEKDIQDYERKLKDRSDIYARIVAVLALGKIGKVNNEVVIKLRNSLSDNEPIVRALAVVVLGKLKDKESLETIRGLAGDDDPVVRGVVALFLGKVGDRKLLPDLEKLTRDEQSSVRASAALGIGMVGDASGIQPLEGLLFSGEEDIFAVKLMSVAALWKLTMKN